MARTFTEREKLLLRAALNPDASVATASWTGWAAQIALEVAPYPELRLLTAVYANLSQVAPGFRLPSKLKGKARATFIQNHLLAREALPTVEKLGESTPVLIAKGLSICARFETWSVRTMGDADVHVPYESLPAALDILAAMGWTPQYGLTIDSLLHRTALRRSSWNFIKGEACLDLHWRPQPETLSPAITRGMWDVAEPRWCLGHMVKLQSVEYATATALAHGFKIGTQGDAVQTVLDASLLLPACRPDVLLPLLDAFDLRGALDTAIASLQEAGAAAITSEVLALRTTAMAPASQGSRNGSATTLSSAGLAVDVETALLRDARLYDRWQTAGRKPWIERQIVKWRGPLSKPVAWTGEFRDNYDLTDCRDMDRIGGPGWGWPEPDGTGFWSDRADARLLVPLRDVADHMVILGLSEQQGDSANPFIDVFANGHRVGAMDLRHNATTSQYCFFVPRAALTSRWIDLSFRPKAHPDLRQVQTETYGRMRGLPVTRLRVYDAADASRLFSQQSISTLHLKILGGAEPETSTFARIRDRISSSPYRNDPALPEGFDPLVYVFAYRDLFDAAVDPYEHFVHQGRIEGRRWR